MGLQNIPDLLPIGSLTTFQRMLLPRMIKEPWEEQGKRISIANTPLDSCSSDDSEDHISIPEEPPARVSLACNAQGGLGIIRKGRLGRKAKEGARRQKNLFTGINDLLLVCAPPVSEDQSLRARYLDLVEAKDTPWHPGFLWGNWLKLVALRLGRSRALDDATLCFVAGTFAHQNRSDENMKVAWQTYGRALGSIQNAVARPEAVSTETIAATKFLTAFEVSDSLLQCNQADKAADHARSEVVSMDSTLPRTWCAVHNERS